MRIDREKLELFLRNIRINESADQKKLTDKELVMKIAEWFEKEYLNPNQNTKPWYQE
jgi:hypothetical protein